MLMEEGVSRSKKFDIQPKICSHLAIEKKDASFQRAMIYLKLINEGCDRQQSLNFAAKRVCMADCTAKMEGPPSFRIKVKQDKKAFHINGWMNIEQQYDMGNEYRNGIHEILKENEQLEHAFNKDVVSNVEKPKLEYHHKLQVFRRFLRDQDKKLTVDLKKIKEQDKMIEKVRTLRDYFKRPPPEGEDRIKSPSKRSYNLYDPAVCRHPVMSSGSKYESLRPGRKAE